MTEVEAEVVRSLMLLVLVIVFYMWPYQRMRAVSLERDLRTIRDDLWDYMNRCGRGFDDPAYLDMRLCFNGFIRLARNQRVGSWYVAGLIIGKWLSLPSVSTDFAVADKKLKQKLNEAESQMRRRVLKFLFLEGVFGLVLYPIKWLIYFSIRRDLLTKWQNFESIELLQRYAFCVGKMPIPQARMMFGIDVFKGGET